MQKTTVVLVDDLDGGEADESVSFALDGVEMSIDLSSRNAQGLRSFMQKYVESAQRVGGRSRRVAAPTATRLHGSLAAPRRSHAELQAIREWARAQGENVSDRGRIPLDIMNAFADAHRPKG